MILKEIELELDKLIEEQGMSYMRGELIKTNFSKQCKVVKQQLINDNKYTDLYYKQICLFSLEQLRNNINNIKQV